MISIPIGSFTDSHSRFFTVTWYVSDQVEVARWLAAFVVVALTPFDVTAWKLKAPSPCAG